MTKVKLILGCILTVIALGFITGVYYNIQHKVWLKTHCTIVSEAKGQFYSHVVIDMNGKPSVVNTVTNDTVGYQCDDGKTYFE